MVLRFGPNPTPMFAILQDMRESGLYNRGRVMVAFANVSGVAAFRSAVGENLCANTDFLLGTSMQGTEAQAIAHLCAQGNSVGVIISHQRQTFHPKIYLFDDGTLDGLPQHAMVIVGSSNLYQSSLCTNFEANVEHVLQPAENEEDAELWHSAMQIWQSDDVEQLAHIIGSGMPDSGIEPGHAEQEIRFLMRNHVLRRRAVRRPRSGRTGNNPNEIFHVNYVSSPAVQIDQLPEHGLNLEIPNGNHATDEGADNAEFFGDSQSYVTELKENEWMKLIGYATQQDGPRRTDGGREVRIGRTRYGMLPEFWGEMNTFVDNDGVSYTRTVSVDFEINSGLSARLDCTLRFTTKVHPVTGDRRLDNFNFQYPFLTNYLPQMPDIDELRDCLFVITQSTDDDVDYMARLVLRGDSDYEAWRNRCTITRRAGFNERCGYFPPLQIEEE